MAPARSSGDVIATSSTAVITSPAAARRRRRPSRSARRPRAHRCVRSRRGCGGYAEQGVLGHLAGAQLVDQRLGRVDGDGEADVLGLAGDRGVDADDLALHVEQRPAGVAGVDRGVGLQQVRRGARRWARRGTARSPTRCPVVTVGPPDRSRALPMATTWSPICRCVGVAERQRRRDRCGRPSARRGRSSGRRRRPSADSASPSLKSDRDVGGPVDDVVVGDDVAVGARARSRCRRPGPRPCRPKMSVWAIESWMATIDGSALVGEGVDRVASAGRRRRGGRSGGRRALAAAAVPPSPSCGDGDDAAGHERADGGAERRRRRGTDRGSGRRPAAPPGDGAGWCPAAAGGGG